MSEAIVKFLGMLVWGAMFVAIVCVILGAPVWILWNLLIPSLFGLPAIGFWEAVGLNILCSLLFKSTTSPAIPTKKNDTTD